MSSDDRPTDGHRNTNEILKQGELKQAELKVTIPKIISFEELSRCGEEVWIENRGALYRLRRTKQGKLILTK